MYSRLRWNLSEKRKISARRVDESLICPSCRIKLRNMWQSMDAIRATLSSAPSSLGNEHCYVMDFESIDPHTSKTFDGLLKNASDIRPKLSTLKAIRKASSRPYDWKDRYEVDLKKAVDPNHALRALASEQDEEKEERKVVLATNPRRISRKLNALRGQLASAPSSLHGHLHSACYESLFKTGDLTRHRPKLDARALSMRSRTVPNTPRSALMMQYSNTGHNTPVYGHSRHTPTARPRPGSAATTAARAAVERLRTAPAALFPDYDLRQFRPLSSTSTTRKNRQFVPRAPPGKLHHGSLLNQEQEPSSALKRPLTMEEEQLRDRFPGRCKTKSVTFNCKPTSPYNCKMSNRAKKSKSYRELNYTSVTGRTGIPLDVEFMEYKAKNSVNRACEHESLVKRPAKNKNTASDLHQSALHFATALNILGEEVGAQQEKCARLTRSLKQQKEMLRLIKRTKGRRPFTCDNIMCEVSTLALWGDGRSPSKLPS